MEHAGNKLLLKKTPPYRRQLYHPRTGGSCTTPVPTVRGSVGPHSQCRWFGEKKVSCLSPESKDNSSFDNFQVRHPSCVDRITNIDKCSQTQRHNNSDRWPCNGRPIF